MDPEQTNGLNVAPPLADDEQSSPTTLDQVGQARLEKVIGKVIGGTVIASDILPGDLPSVDKLEAEKAEHPAPEPASPTPTPVPVTPQQNGTPKNKPISKPTVPLKKK
ncbi:hypothetical protein BGZ92_005601 [Podila epicladia]|nr:hypothetical protein BGZ92_005601 [Podila epicladia]